MTDGDGDEAYKREIKKEILWIKLAYRNKLWNYF